jgi:hypothetical protein
MKCCEICGRESEEHHIVFRSQASYMVKVELNKKLLCPEHHKGNDGPHLNRKTDLKYKLELQKKLFELFSKDYYKAPEIKELLGLRELNMFSFIKILNPVGDKGFARLDIVMRCMGGKLYGV